MLYVIGITDWASWSPTTWWLSATQTCAHRRTNAPIYNADKPHWNGFTAATNLLVFDEGLFWATRRAHWHSNISNRYIIITFDFKSMCVIKFITHSSPRRFLFVNSRLSNRALDNVWCLVKNKITRQSARINPWLICRETRRGTGSKYFKAVRCELMIKILMRLTARDNFCTRLKSECICFLFFSSVQINWSTSSLACRSIFSLFWNVDHKARESHWAKCFGSNSLSQI